MLLCTYLDRLTNKLMSVIETILYNALYYLHFAVRLFFISTIPFSTLVKFLLRYIVRVAHIVNQLIG